MPELTRDEQYLRRYFLEEDYDWRRAIRSELPFLLPALVIAGLALVEHAHDVAWLAFFYLLGLYVWRTSYSKWGRAMRSLIEKYESRIAELENSRPQ